MSLGSRIATWWRAVSGATTRSAGPRGARSFTSRAMPKTSCASGLPREQAMRRARAELGSLAASTGEMPGGVGHEVGG